MQTFKFSTKEQGRIYSILTAAVITLGIILLFQWNNLKLDSSLAFMIVSIISFISLIISLKKASKTFVQISIDANRVNFHFANKMKDNIQICIEEIELIEKNDELEVVNNEDGTILGKAYRNRIENKEDWSVLIQSLNRIKIIE